ncbi:MAG: DUF4363 family protein [Ruminiclostridium sp.]|nr:DUF4363 family protein [Ruminiclostridium sp.]
MNQTFKVLLSVAVLAAIIFGMGFISQRILIHTSSELEKELSKVEDSTVSNDWNTAEKSLKKVQETWSGIKKTWAMLIDHMEIDNIDITLTRVEKYVLCKDTSSALAEAAALMKYIRHIPKKEALNIENIF